MKGYPQVLYRYRHLEGEHREYTRQIITDSVLYFASPSSFNDPFDCKVHYQNSLSMLQLQAYYERLLQQRSPHLSDSERKERINAELRHMEPSYFIAQVTQGMQSAANDLGILSLSATKSNILLWSHYAASHSGICLKFKATNTTLFFGYAQPVIYAKEYPKIDLLNNSPDEQVEAFLRTKALDCQYEKEWRIIDTKNGPGLYQFPEELLEAVIFGAKISKPDKDDVLKWIATRKCPVQVFQSFLSPGSFGLSFKPYDADYA
ncbi:DUF2971 domain-containing protein [Geomonas oryzae]|uniref:DUF2971 domain-containing protein n=1 Tax=Geomonas oryzae TaxID=2364273 RepID=UPI00100BAC93|nr:DUF2971 domain-containing protein [Geomonas oryzae]